MSVVFIVVPVVAAGWPIMCGAIAAAAGALGYTTLAAGSCRVTLPERDGTNAVVIPLEDSQVVAETMARESQFTIVRDEISATFSRAADGRCMVHVAGENKTDAELDAVGKELIGHVTQQYAYNKVLTELKGQGFTVTSEEVTNDQMIRIHVSKYV